VKCMMYKVPVNLDVWTQNQLSDDLHDTHQLGFIYHRQCESNGIRVSFVVSMVECGVSNGQMRYIVQMVLESAGHTSTASPRSHYS
jgi:hypothetical protein